MNGFHAIDDDDVQSPKELTDIQILSTIPVSPLLSSLDALPAATRELFDLFQVISWLGSQIDPPLSLALSSVNRMLHMIRGIEEEGGLTASTSEDKKKEEVNNDQCDSLSRIVMTTNAISKKLRRIEKVLLAWYVAQGWESIGKGTSPQTVRRFAPQPSSTLDQRIVKFLIWIDTNLSSIEERIHMIYLYLPGISANAKANNSGNRSKELAQHVIEKVLRIQKELKNMESTVNLFPVRTKDPLPSAPELEEEKKSEDLDPEEVRKVLQDSFDDADYLRDLATKITEGRTTWVLPPTPLKSTLDSSPLRTVGDASQSSSEATLDKSSNTVLIASSQKITQHITQKRKLGRLISQHTSGKIGFWRKPVFFIVGLRDETLPGGTVPIAISIANKSGKSLQSIQASLHTTDSIFLDKQILTPHVGKGEWEGEMEYRVSSALLPGFYFLRVDLSATKSKRFGLSFILHVNRP